MRDCWVSTIEELKDKDSRLCIAELSPRSAGTRYSYNPGRLLPESVAAKMAAAVGQIVLSASEGAAPRIDVTEAETRLAAIHAKLISTFGSDWDLLADEDAWMQHSDRVCEMLLALYRETQKLPVASQGNLLRYMVTWEDPTDTEE